MTSFPLSSRTKFQKGSKLWIDGLTPEQEAKLAAYRDAWTGIGLSTSTDRAATEAAVDRLYKAAGRDPPRLKIWCQSPMATALAVAIISRLPELAARVAGAVDSAVRSAVHSAVDSAVDSAVHSAVRSAVDSAVRSAVHSAVGSALHSAVGSAVHSAVGSFDWYNAWWGSYWWVEGWGAYIAYMREVFGVQVGELGEAMVEMARQSRDIWTFEHAVFLSHKPVEIHTNARGQTHKDGGLAVRYGDGWGVWALNGVRVSREIAETSADELRVRLVLDEKNAEVRREIVKKIGIKHVLNGLGARVIDSMGSYELLELDLQDGRRRPYLKMLNPSIEEVHVEGVHPDCKTVAQALAWRNGMDVYTAPKVLT